MGPIKEALTFDDVTLEPKYSQILPSDVDTSIKLTDNIKLKVPILSSAMDTVTESKMCIAIAKAGGIGVIHRNLDIKKQIAEIRKVKKQKFLVGAAVGAGANEFERAKIVLRRTEPSDACIGFHCDGVFASKTVSYALNDDSDYVGGSICFITSFGLTKPNRPAGTITVHNREILHGVTKLHQGTRYNLFVVVSFISSKKLK